MARKGVTLIILEDEPAHAEAIRRALEESGRNIDIRMAATLREYRELVAADPPDMVLADILLRDGRAMEILTSPPEYAPFPVIVMTSCGNEQLAVDAMRAGALDYLVKSPETLAALPRTLEGALRQWDLLRERKRAEDARVEEVRKFRAIADYTADWESWSGPEGRLLWVNPSVERITGYTVGECLSMEGYPLPIIAEEDRAMVAERIRTITGPVMKDPMEFRIRRKDGALRWAEVTWQQIFDEAGNSMGHRSSVRDITGRKRAEEALRETQDLLNEVGRIARIGGWKMDLITRRSTLTRAMQDIVEIGPGEHVPGPDEHLELYLPEYRPMLAEAMRALIEDDTPLDVEARMRTPRGTIKWCRAIGRARRKNGRAVEIFGTLQDITERKRAEEALRETQDLLNEVGRIARIGGWKMDLTTRMSTWTQGTYGIVEIEPGDPIPGPDEHLGFYLPEYRPLVAEAMRALIEDDTPLDFVAPLRTARGNVKWCRAIGRARRRGGKAVEVYGTFQDITERTRAEEKEREMERRLLHAQKLESLGVLAGGIAHDFNNLLTAILGNMDLALDGLSPLSPARRSIEEAIHATKRAECLTRQMLAYSGKGRFIVNDMDLSELVEENSHLLKAALSKGTMLDLRLDKRLPPIAADAGQIQQVVMNLITNASESLGDKAGIVNLSTGAMDCDEEYLGRSRLEEKPAPGRFVFLEVADTGCGMDEETKGRLFDPFFTTKFTGRGLGMSAVLGIIRGHRGAIMVMSEVGRGSAIRVLFPVSGTGAGRRGKRAARGMKRGGKPRASGTILIVDDEKMVRIPCAAMAAHAGYRTLTAANGDEAAAIFRDHADEIACVILDMTMPGKDGVATFEALRKIRPDVRVILSSGYNEQETTQRLAGHGLAGFIKKPYAMSALLAELERVITA